MVDDSRNESAAQGSSGGTAPPEDRTERSPDVVGHGDFRPANAPAGVEGLRTPERHQPNFGGDGTTPWGWAGEPPTDCKATTKEGNPCKARPVEGTGLCYFHSQSES